MKSKWTRREFVATGSAGAIGTLLLAHLLSGATDPSSTNKEHRIHEIKLRTSTSLDEIRSFYHSLLGFSIKSQSETHCSFIAGLSLVTFLKTDNDATGAPFYHFAFNIPENMIGLVEKWLAPKTPIIEAPSHLRDSDYSNNIVHFGHWNAHSVFFYDPAGNVVEFIARHDLKNPSKSQRFESKDILYVSEIGLVTDDVNKLYNAISKQFGLYTYKGGSERFTAVGDEYGLILLMNSNTRAAFNQGRKRETYPTQIILNDNAGNEIWEAPGLPFTIASKKG
ncbi:hypothetical protein POV27_07795 [Aureisphaera galaxeae]|uniref:VOC family protein n=1 Tax=Aureisphaera galaxeae TaxID=1538023 RepID=UPI002350D63C|nr:VOC family protein [Aureisphaera galaxeae]MDC8003951.1 hypothetical protein [Aureisphaera galaxeae]